MLKLTLLSDEGYTGPSEPIYVKAGAIVFYSLVWAWNGFRDSHGVEPRRHRDARADHGNGCDGVRTISSDDGQC